jgi:hypothetical protein
MMSESGTQSKGKSIMKLFLTTVTAAAITATSAFAAYSGGSGHPFRQHPATCSRVSGHL